MCFIGYTAFIIKSTSYSLKTIPLVATNSDLQHFCIVFTYYHVVSVVKCDYSKGLNQLKYYRSHEGQLCNHKMCKQKVKLLVFLT